MKSGRSGIRRRQRRRSKAHHLAELMRRLARLPRVKRAAIIAKIEDAIAATGAE